MRVFILTLLAMIAFAGNSLLCRQALKRTTIDAASFTFIRILSGAVVLWLVVMLRKGTRPKAGTWASALALFRSEERRVGKECRSQRLTDEQKKKKMV